MKTGILLAGGKASRFGGVRKELLPTGEDRVVLDTSIEAFRNWGAEKIIVVTSQENWGIHVSHFSNSRYDDLNLFFEVQQGKEMWGAVETALPHATEQNCLLMADTIVNPFQFTAVPEGYPLVFGTFYTNQPGQYSVFVDGKIVTKDIRLNGTGTYSAWGAVFFDHTVVNHWSLFEYFHYDAAFNHALSNYIHAAVPIGPYFDIGNWSRYLEYLRGTAL